MDVKEREKREKGDQGKQSHRFDPQFYLQIVILIEHGIERGLVANDGCDHIAVRMCCFSHAFLIASCKSYNDLGNPDLAFNLQFLH